MCENILSNLLDEYVDTPWEALKYLIADANYGGRVTDEWDRRILRAYINRYFCEDAISAPMFPLSSMATYYIPESTDLQGCLEYIATLPNFDKPEAFGQHPNADIATQIRESNELLRTLLSLQPQSFVGSGAVTREERVLAVALEIAKRVPENIDYQRAQKYIQHEHSPLGVVLLQEIIRYNRLLSVIRESITNLERGIRGVVVMSPELEETLAYIGDGKVPPLWSKEYISEKPLGSWTRELVQRVEQFAEWGKGFVQNARFI